MRGERVDHQVRGFADLAGEGFEGVDEERDDAGVTLAEHERAADVTIP